MVNQIKTAQLFEQVNPYLADFVSKFEYPWQMLPEIKGFILGLIEGGLDGFTEVAPQVFVAEGVKIYPTATLEGPAIFCKGCEIRPGAFVRGAVFAGEGCVIGNSSELKNCILMDKVQVPHYNYVGDSVLGFHAHMGAGAVCSNLKADGKGVVVRGDEAIETGLRKFGAILGDNADIGCGCILNPGTVVGQRTSVYPLTALRGVYPADCIVKATREVVERV